MIYLIDDKEKRQKSFGWTKDILKKHSGILSPIHNALELDKLREMIFSNPSNCVLLHESFFEARENFNRKNSFQIRSELEAYANNNSSFLLCIFSGSKNSRVLENNIAHLPVSLLYQNLESFIIRCKAGSPQLEYLLFGKNPEIEKVLATKFSIYKKLFAKNVLNNSLSLTNEIKQFNEITEGNFKIENEMEVTTLKKMLNG